MFDKDVAEYMLTLIDGNLIYLRETAIQHKPGEVLHHHHHDDDHEHHHDHDHHHHDHSHDEFESIVVELPEQTDPADFAARVERLANEQNILRVKGYVAIEGKPMRLLVQAVGARVRHQFDRPWKPEEGRQGKVVVIAEHDNINSDAIRAALAGELDD